MVDSHSENRRADYGASVGCPTFCQRSSCMLSIFQQSAPVCLCSIAVVFCSTLSLAQNTSSTVPPVIDVHVHAMDESFPGGPMCPNEARFLASDPRTKEATNGWDQEECTPKLYPAAKGEYIK